MPRNGFAQNQNLARCKEGDLPLLKFSNLTCMHLYSVVEGSILLLSILISGCHII